MQARISTRENSITETRTHNSVGEDRATDLVIVVVCDVKAMPVKGQAQLIDGDGAEPFQL